MKNKKQTAKTTLVDKLRGGGEGPVTFTQGEVQRLHGAFEDISQEILQCRRAMHGIAEALQRHNLQVTETTNPDGSVGFDLENVPSPPVGDAPAPATLN